MMERAHWMTLLKRSRGTTTMVTCSGIPWHFTGKSGIAIVVGVPVEMGKVPSSARHIATASSLLIQLLVLLDSFFHSEVVEEPLASRAAHFASMSRIGGQLEQ